MPINITEELVKTPHQTAADELGPVDEQSDMPTQEMATTEMVETENVESGETSLKSYEKVTEPVTVVHENYCERVEVGVSFRMPVAEYTMLEFTVRRTVPFDNREMDADTVFEHTKKWVEDRVNQMIGEQSQAAGAQAA